MNYAGKPFLPDPLTEREIDVLSLMADGLSNSEIAEKLFLGLETVRWHTKQIYSKLGVHSRMQASLRARQLGILAGEEGTPSAPPPVSEVLWLHNLPVYTTPIVGRDHELHELDTLINNPAVRLITIVGSGGMGKTRLSAELARMQLNNFVDGVYFIPLVSVRSAADLEQAILNGMHLALKEDTPPLVQVVHHLKTRHILLLLDNFEHVLDGVELVATLLEGTTSVKILVTSHISLNLREEWVRTIDPLSVPEANDTSDIADYSAVQLFDVCVKRVRGDFVLQNHLQAVIEICRAVQGIPIAIELAAAWLKTLSCEDVARAIRANIDFLATKQRDVQERHRSIQAVFDYAWNLLTEDEQRVFRRLSVFRGGFSLAAAEQVAGASIHTLSELVGKSLLQQSSAGLYVIQDLLRQYAERKLEDLDASKRSTRSSNLLAWTAFVKGDFDKVEEVAKATLKLTSDNTSDPNKAFALAALGALAGIDEDYPRCKQLCEASLAMVQNDPISLIISYLGLAIAECGLEDLVSAKRYIRLALEQSVMLRSPAFNILCLPIVSIILAYEMKPERAVELLALAYTHPASSLGWLKKWPMIAQLEADLQADIAAPDYAALWEHGQSLELQPIVDNLLLELNPHP